MKRPIRQEVREFGSIVLVFLIIVIIFSWLCGLFEAEPSEKTSYEDNVQLNNIEQHHRSEGHPILFVEDIFLD